jgi:hypothetical protein
MALTFQVPGNILLYTCSTGNEILINHNQGSDLLARVAISCDIIGSLKQIEGIPDRINRDL